MMVDINDLLSVILFVCLIILIVVLVILVIKLIKTLKKVNVILEDERLSSVEANNIMISGDLSRKKRKEKVDSIAASIILQRFLDRR